MIKIADISLLNACNFNCDYCKSNANHVRQNNKHNIWDINSPVLDYYPLLQFIKTHLNDYIIQLTGGEPLLMPGIEYLVNEIPNQVIINTNGSLLSNKINRFNKNIFFRISMHPDQRPIDKFKDQLDTIKEHKFLINYVLHPRHLRNGLFFTYREWLHKSGYNYEITPFEGEYDKEYYRLFNTIYDNLITYPETMEDQEIIVIKPNGLVFPCHGVLDDKHPIGDIYSNEFNKAGICKLSCQTPNHLSICPTYDPIVRINRIINS